MNKILFLILFLTLTKLSVSQNLQLTSEERAYLYHVTIKSPTIYRNIGELFNYKGDTIYFKFKYKKQTDSIIDYDAIEQKIIYEPSILEINTYEFSNIENGILAELASKLALQALYKELKRKDEVKIEGMSNQIFDSFIDTLTNALPSKALRYRNDKNEASPKIIELLEPNLSFFGRYSQLKELSGFNLAEQQQVMNAIYKSIQVYIQEKGKEYYKKIGGKGDFNSYLLAVGDGSSTAGLLNEKELIRESKNKLGKPKGIGLFTYETKFKIHKKNNQILTPKQSTEVDYSALKDDLTNIHLSMWGFNRKLQTTVVIRNKDSVYLLYASKVSKELSPDTTFGQGNTMHSTISKLEHKSIPNLDEEINGKEGLKYQLKKAKEDKALNLMKIKEAEYNLKSGSQKNNKLKNKKKIVTRQNGQERVNSSKGTIKSLQNKLARLMARQIQIERILADAEFTLKEEEARIQRFRDRLKVLKGYIDGKQLSYSQFGYIYTFEDGCTFNSYTQNFKIPKHLKIKDFSIRLIAIGSDALSTRVDEIQLLTNVTTGVAEDLTPHNFELSFNDVFKADKYRIKKLNLKETERFELSKLMYQLLIHKKDLLFDLKGDGIGKNDKGSIIPSTEKELDAYPGETEEERQQARESSQFKTLRTTALKLTEEPENIILSVNSFTDPVKSHFSKKSLLAQPLKEKYKCTENQLLSGFRTYTVFERFYGELLRATYFTFEEKERTKILSLLKKQFDKSHISVNNHKIKLKEFEEIMHSEATYYDLKIEQFQAEEKKIKTLLEF